MIIEDVFEVKSLFTCTSIELYWRGRDTVCYAHLAVFVDNGIEPMVLISTPTWISYDCPKCVEPIVLEKPLIRDTIVASNRHLENTPKKPLCSLPQTIHNSTSVTIGGWKRCLTIVHSSMNMKVLTTKAICQSKVFQFYKCARKIDKGCSLKLSIHKFLVL